MTDDRVAPDQGEMRNAPPRLRMPSLQRAEHGNQQAAGYGRLAVCPRTLAGITFLLTGLVLAGCSSNPDVVAGSTLRVYAADLAGAAKVCDVPKVNLVPGSGFDAPINVANDGGWCGIRVHQDGPKPFEAGLLTARPKHGTILIHEVGDETRIDYTPDRGFAGTDAFVVKLIPGNASIKGAVTVTAPQS